MKKKLCLFKILTPAVVLLLFSSMASSGKAAEDAGITESFFIDLPGSIVAITHGGDLALSAGPSGIQLLSEQRIRHGIAILAKVRNAEGEIIGFASELEVLPGDENFLKGNVIYPSDWTVVIPGRGSLYLHHREHLGELGTKVIGPTLATGEPWTGELTVSESVGPHKSGLGVVAGGSGEFKDNTGTFAEIVTATQFVKEGVLTGRVELRVTRFGPQ